MEKNMKAVFMIGEGVSVTKEFLSRISEEITEEVDNFYFCGRLIIQVPIEKYEETLLKGTEIAKKMNLKSIEWIDHYNKVKHFGYVSFGYGFLPKGREGMELWSDTMNHAPYDIKRYCERLSLCLDTNVIIEYNAADNAVEFSAKGDIHDHAMLVEKFKKYNSILIKGLPVKIESPFREVAFLTYTGELLDQSKKKESPYENNELASYLFNSVFYEGIVYPEGLNIVPKNSEDPNENLKTGFHPSRTKNYCDCFNISSVIRINGDALMFNGNYIVKSSYSGWRYYDSQIKKEKSEPTIRDFIMIDNADYDCFISYDDQNLTVTSKALVRRNTMGYLFGNKTPYDAYYANCNHFEGDDIHQDCKFKMDIVDNYKIVDNDYLLHTSNISPTFEIFKLPANFKIENGIKGLSPIVYEQDMGDQEFETEEEKVAILIKQSKSL